jgi:hypothetical protein
MRDFTLKTYRSLCLEFHKHGYNFITFADYCENNTRDKHVILRHDVDSNPENALRMAFCENRLNIRSSYYFRIIRNSFAPDIIQEIAALGHEIGYHYEDLSIAKGRMQYAIELFKKNLALFRKSYPVRTICMHGSPVSRWDNRAIWEHYDYHDFGIIGEPYLDVNFAEVLYLTDTGRKWDGADVSVRDKMEIEHNCSVKKTSDIIAALKSNEMPRQIMLNVHPQRWHDAYTPWLIELLWQGAKNIGKRYLVKTR